MSGNELTGVCQNTMKDGNLQPPPITFKATRNNFRSRIKTMKPLVIALAASFLAAGVHAAEIIGTVRSAIEEYATVRSNSDLMPKPGDKAQIFFKIAGAEDEISVAEGYVYEITAGNIMVKIESATGTVENGQLVRFKSNGAPKTSSSDEIDVPNTFNEAQSVIEARERGASPSASPRTQATASDFVGRWKVQYQDVAYVLRLRQEGNRVVGTYDFQGGTLSGTVRAGALHATWKQTGNKRGGPATLRLSADGETLSGTWQYDPAIFSSGLRGSGAWSFRRISRSP